MTNQPGFPAAPAAGVAAAAIGSSDDVANEGSSTDDGEPVGAADARADEERASGDDHGDDSDEDVLNQGSSTDDGVPVGAADARADEERASRDGDEADE
jgi:hypothetical protein